MEEKMKQILKAMGALFLVFLLVASVPVFARETRNARDLIKIKEAELRAKIDDSVIASSSGTSWTISNTHNVNVRDAQKIQATSLIKGLAVLYSAELFNFQNFISSKIKELKDNGVDADNIAYFAKEANKVVQTLQSAQGNYFMGWLYFKPKSFAEPDYTIAVKYFTQAKADFDLFKQQLISLAQLFNQLKNGQ